MTDTHPTRMARRQLLRAATAGLLGSSLLPQALWAQDALSPALLRGAGSTFVFPLVSQWIKEYREGTLGADYHAGNAGLDGDLLGRAALDYEPIGSLAGLQRLQAKAVDFALSELPLSHAALQQQGLLQLPIVLGGVAIVANLDGLSAPLRLDGATLAAVYRGRVARWNDPAIAALNPDATLPNTAIVPLHRLEGSGTTFTLTSYLARQDARWQDEVGVDALVRWPLGMGVRGSSGMAQTLRATPGSIGYLDAVQAGATGLGVVALRNPAGHFVTATVASIEAAAQSSGWQARMALDPMLIDAEGEASYPIAATVLAVLRAQPQRRGDRRARLFLQWALANGQQSARQLGYVALPHAAAAQVLEQLHTG